MTVFEGIALAITVAALLPTAFVVAMQLRSSVLDTRSKITSFHHELRRLYHLNHDRVVAAKARGIPIIESPERAVLPDLQADAANPEGILTRQVREGGDPITRADDKKEEPGVFDHAKQLKRMFEDLHDLAKRSGLLDALTYLNYVVLLAAILAMAVSIKLTFFTAGAASPAAVAVFVISIVVLIVDIIAKLIGHDLDKTQKRQLDRLMAEAKEKGIDLSIVIPG
ncbi:MAG: hypothetical protein GY765_36770 [bacterium]|nr:hypothetical protein [bacterium]